MPPMHELFLTASVKSGDFDTVCAILQGLTWMTARRTIYRILFFAGQPQPKGLPSVPPNLLLPRTPENKQLWGELSQQLLRSSYILQAAYEVSPETDFGNNVTVEFGRLPATLRWTDLPDPTRDSPITSRKKIDITIHGNLPSILIENKHTYTNELIQESYSFNRGDVEFLFSRYYHLPDSPGRPVQHLPAWADLRPVDPAQKWVLNVKLNVSGDGQPEKIRKANEELMRVKVEFEKLFDFKTIDRRVFDTRIAPPLVLPGRGPP
ncbi:mediator complex, subunit Med18 [Xylariaceae sp. FL1651]|nr:mediator complex, subunit Med18 [Xylariaceae sp. FL1651]